MAHKVNYDFNRSRQGKEPTAEQKLAVATLMSNSDIEKQTAIDALTYCKDHPEITPTEYVALIGNPLFMTKLKIAERRIK
jgi:hypothetical protein